MLTERSLLELTLFQLMKGFDEFEAMLAGFDSGISIKLGVIDKTSTLRTLSLSRP